MWFKVITFSSFNYQIISVLSSLETRLHLSFYFDSRMRFKADLNKSNNKLTKKTENYHIIFNFSNILQAFFHMKSVTNIFSLITFGFVNLCQKDFGIQAAHKMFLKLAVGVNFITILYAAFYAQRS